MSYEDIISRVADTNGYSKRLVDKVYKAYWKAVREHITSLPLWNDLSDEEFMELQPNVNIPSIGKLYVTLDRYQKVMKRHKLNQESKNKRYVTHQED